MMHWSPATQIGVIESWPLCDGDRAWSQNNISWTNNMDEFRAQYWALNKTFNPICFQPKKVAKLAKDCGFKYLLFTTKHHDGFCMYDTAETDYKITAPDCPFSNHKYADITNSLFEAFRAEGLAVSAYFSKPDWYSDVYWHRAFGQGKSRDLNYDVFEYPDMWEEFVGYTHRQLIELTANYGKIDVLWLDGGWVRPDNLGQDIRLGEVVEKIRAESQPHLIVCDRTVGGPYENIVTPEQGIPDKPLHIPWEACITLGNHFSFHYEDEYKSAREVIHMFLDIVSKGGSLALNITLQPDGGIPHKAVTVLSQMGRWLNAHGEGIYHSVISPLAPHPNIVYTQANGRTYVFFLFDDTPHLPTRLFLRRSGNISEIRHVRTNSLIPFTIDGENLCIDTSEITMLGAEFADCFVIQ
jgi:alpha-L-fucosidase